MFFFVDKTDLSIVPDEERQAQHLIKSGQIDQAITIYEQIKPESARICTTIGVLYVEMKNDYDNGIIYYNKALIIQQENDEDISGTLTELGNAYQNRCEFDLALEYHVRALSLRKLAGSIDRILVAKSLVGIANVYWGQHNLSAALDYAQQALTLNQSIESGNDLNTGLNLGVFASIYHGCGDDDRALEVAKQALILLERCVLSNSPILAVLLNNIAVIQAGKQRFTDAKQTFIRLLQIYEKTLPKGHPKRIKVEKNIQRISLMEQRHDVNFYSHLWKLLSKILLLS